eukprot:gene3652-4550_t
MEKRVLDECMMNSNYQQFKLEILSLLIKNGNWELVEKLVDSGLVSGMNDFKICIYKASRYGQLEILEFLVETAKVKLNDSDSELKQPLKVAPNIIFDAIEIASRKGEYETFKYLKDNEWPIKNKSKILDTPNIKILEILLENNWIPGPRGQKRRIYYLNDSDAMNVFGGDLAVLKMLESKNVVYLSEHSFDRAAKLGYLDIVKELHNKVIFSVIDTSFIEISDITIKNAIDQGHTQVVDYLLDNYSPRSECYFGQPVKNEHEIYELITSSKYQTKSRNIRDVYVPYRGSSFNSILKFISLKQEHHKIRISAIVKNGDRKFLEYLLAMNLLKIDKDFLKTINDPNVNIYRDEPFAYYIIVDILLKYVSSILDYSQPNTNQISMKYGSSTFAPITPVYVSGDRYAFQLSIPKPINVVNYIATFSNGAASKDLSLSTQACVTPALDLKTMEYPETSATKLRYLVHVQSIVMDNFPTISFDYDLYGCILSPSLYTCEMEPGFSDGLFFINLYPKSDSMNSDHSDVELSISLFDKTNMGNQPVSFQKSISKVEDSSTVLETQLYPRMNGGPIGSIRSKVPITSFIKVKDYKSGLFYHSTGDTPPYHFQNNKFVKVVFENGVSTFYQELEQVSSSISNIKHSIYRMGNKITSLLNTTFSISINKPAKTINDPIYINGQNSWDIIAQKNEHTVGIQYLSTSYNMEFPYGVINGTIFDYYHQTTQFISPHRVENFQVKFSTKSLTVTPNAAGTSDTTAPDLNQVPQLNYISRCSRDYVLFEISASDDISGIGRIKIETAGIPTTFTADLHLVSGDFLNGVYKIPYLVNRKSYNRFIVTLIDFAGNQKSYKSSDLYSATNQTPIPYFQYLQLQYLPVLRIISPYDDSKYQEFIGYMSSRLKLYVIPFYIPINSMPGKLKYEIDNFEPFTSEQLEFLYGEKAVVNVVSSKSDLLPPMITKMVPIIGKLVGGKTYCGWNTTIVDDTGFSKGYINVTSNLDKITKRVSTDLTKRVDGTNTNGVYELLFECPTTNCMTQTYSITGVYLEDRVNHPFTVPVDGLSKIEGGEPQSFSVETCTLQKLDIEPPVFSVFSFSPSSVDVSSGNPNDRTITFNLKTFDNRALSPQHFPIVYISAIDTEPISFTSELESCESEKTCSYKCVAVIPYGFGIGNKLFISVYGITDSFFNLKGQTTSQFPSNLQYIERLNSKKPTLIEHSYITKFGGRLYIKGSGLLGGPSQNRVKVDFKNSTTSEIIPNGVHGTLIYFDLVAFTQSEIFIHVINSFDGEKMSNVLKVVPNLGDRNFKDPTVLPPTPEPTGTPSPTPTTKPVPCPNDCSGNGRFREISPTEDIIKSFNLTNSTWEFTNATDYNENSHSNSISYQVLHVVLMFYSSDIYFPSADRGECKELKDPEEVDIFLFEHQSQT